MWATLSGNTWMLNSFETIPLSLHSFFKLIFLLKDNCFTEFCFLSSLNMNQPCLCESRSVMSDSLRPHGLYILWNSPGQNTWVGSVSLLQGFLPTQGSNLGLSHCRRILYQLSHKESSRILERVAYPFSRGSSRPRNWTGVSCIAGREQYSFTNWAIREALKLS